MAILLSSAYARVGCDEHFADKLLGAYHDGFFGVHGAN